MYFFKNDIEEEKPNNNFSFPPNSALLNNTSQLETNNPIMDRPQYNHYNNDLTKPTYSLNTSETQYQETNNINEKINTQEVASQLDPYDVLGIQSTASIEEVKIAYKYLALKNHPDKGGKQELFDIVNDSYQKIMQRITRIKPKEKIEHNELKKQSKKFSNPNKIKITVNKDKFNLERFNDVYEKNKMYNPYNKGYSDWKEELKDENTTLNSNISSKNFNEAFNKSRKTNSYNKQIIKTEEPTATISGDLGFSELGVDDISSFSKTEGDSNSIGFTDYKDAYTKDSKLINPDEITIERPNTLNKYKSERENISYQMSEKQKELEEIKKTQQEQAEFNRIQRVNLFDEMANEQYNKVNQMMLGNMNS